MANSRNRKIKQVRLPPIPAPLSDHQVETLVDQIIFAGREEQSCNALLVLLEEIQIAGGLALDTDRVLHVALTAQVKAFSLVPIEMDARINKIRARLVRGPARGKRKSR